MKVILSILLSFCLSMTGIPAAGQAEGQWGATAETEQQAQDSVQEEAEISQEGTEVQEEDAAEPDDEDKPEKEAEALEQNADILTEDEELGADILNRVKGQETDAKEEEQQEIKKKSEDAAAPKGKGGQSAESKNKKKETGSIRKKPAQKKSGEDTEIAVIMKAAETTEALAETRESSPVSVNVQQNKEISCLRLLDGEMMYPESKLGYHTAVSRKVNCCHSSLGLGLGSIKCNKAASPLNPTKEELRNNVKLTGSLRGKTIKKKNVTTYNPGGKGNTVTHLNLNVEVQAPGADGTNLNWLVAGPYICAGDGYAGYAYTERHFSYCPSTERYYYVASSHVWLGCTLDRDGGNNEFHGSECSHQFNLYKYIPNSYKVRYDANGGEGTVSGQNASYDQAFALRPGNGFSLTGHTLTGWNTKKDGSGQAYQLGANVSNLTSEDGGIIMLYAQWRPNRLTVRYDANGGSDGFWTAIHSIGFYRDSWPYGNEKRDPADFSFFEIKRTGYDRKDGAEWNTSPDGTGKSFDQDVGYLVTEYAPGITAADQEIVLYAQWEPNVYTVTLDNRLSNPVKSGTEKIYKKYTKGLYLDSRCRESAEQIALPEKKGYQFQGYYNQSGKLMTDSNGRLTADAMNEKDQIGNEIWSARYHYLIGCEDYADIPCDLEKTPEDVREELGVKITYDSSAREVYIHTGQTWCSISLIAQPQGTQIGEIRSSLAAGSVNGNTGLLQGMRLSLNVSDCAAYQLILEKDGRMFCDRLVYYKDGRFRTLVKLGEQEAQTKEQGSSIAGSAWNRKGQEDYRLYRYHGCSELKDIKEPGTVFRYFRYKDVNMAYSGAGATWGKNILEYDVSLENLYQFRDNGFKKEKMETKYTANQKPYQCKVKYSFQGWELEDHSQRWDIGSEYTFAEKQQEKMTAVFAKAEHIGTIADRTTEDIGTYQAAEPIRVLPGLPGSVGEARGNWEGAVLAADSSQAHAMEYINLLANWDSCPTITVTPGEKMEFYEGEEVTKETLISYLTAHDKEDNRDMRANPDLNDKLRIVKISYPKSKNSSQEAYEESYEEDVPSDFLLDTYYLKLEKDESVDILVTFAVTDSIGNITQEEIPVKVKYNYYPTISSEDIFYYLKEEANQGKITAEELIGRAGAADKEDGDITGQLKLKDFDPQSFKLQTQARAEFTITYQVTDAYRKTSYKNVKVMVWDEEAAIAEMPKRYVRYISEKYLHTLEENSSWREPQNMAYLKSVLGNDRAMETWKYTHEDILAVQKWMTEEGKWKIGQEANQAFLSKFARCKQ